MLNDQPQSCLILSKIWRWQRHVHRHNIEKILLFVILANDMRTNLLKFIDTNESFHKCGIGNNVRLHILQKKKFHIE